MTRGNKRLVEQLCEALTRYFRGEGTDPFADLLAPEGRLTMPGLPPDVDGMRAVLPALAAGLSHLRMQLTDLVAEGDLVAYRAVWTATHSGDLMGVPATGRTLTVSETHLDRIRDGKVVEHGGDWDQLGLLQQLGAVPVPA